jgi:hypothetical protein
MTYDEMLSITEQFQNMGLLHDTGKRRDGKIVFVFRWEPSPEMMDELYHYMQSEPASYDYLAAVALGSGMNPGEISATISRLKKLSAT